MVSHMHMDMERSGDVRAIHHNRAFSMVSWLFLGQWNSWGFPQLLTLLSQNLLLLVWAYLNSLSSCSFLFCFSSSKSCLGRGGILRPGGFPRVWLILEGGNFPTTGWVSTFPLSLPCWGKPGARMQPPAKTPFPAGWNQGKGILTSSAEWAGLESCCWHAWSWDFSDWC